MAFPFKTGGDFYNCEAQRMRLHNLGANPTETATGLMYFNTGASNLGKHAVVHDGTDFKALAFVDEIATNAAFKELEEKVDLLIGDDVDTDTIIDSWKEVQAFLADIEDTKTLQGMLSSYLPLSGGTIKGPFGSLIIERNDTVDGYSAICFKNQYGTLGYIGMGGGNSDFGKQPTFYDGSDSYALLHSGNIGEYAMFEKSIKILTSSDDLNNYYDSGYFGWKDGGNPINSIGDNASMLAIKGPRSNDAFQLVFARNTNDMHYRTRVNSTNWQPWKTIAFTDSTVAAAQKLVTSAGADAVTVDTNGFLTNKNGALFYQFGETNNSNYPNYQLFGTSADGYAVVLQGGTLVALKTANKERLWINTSGNVTIGESDLAGTSANAKLCIDGCLAMMRGSGRRAVLGFSEGDLYLGFESVSTYNTYVSGLNVLLSPVNNVGIGTTDPKKKLHVVGDLYVDGNIIATKEVSAGGAGQEGENGDGGAEVIDKELAKGQSSYTIPNTIGRSAVAVSLYEWNANNGSWDMCLADISVKDATITVTFGSATSVNHKLVAVG